VFINGVWLVARNEDKNVCGQNSVGGRIQRFAARAVNQKRIKNSHSGFRRILIIVFFVFSSELAMITFVQ
jgi:hypothetical protein